MSKMSQLHLELSEQAFDLGFESLEEAFDNGYEVISDGNFAHLVKTEDEQDEAHEAWLKEKQVILGDLNNLLIHKAFDFDIIKRAIEFIEKGEE